MPITLDPLALLTIEELTALDPEGPSLPTDTANLLINISSAMIRDYCGWKITQETVTSQIVKPAGRWLFLPTLHLTAMGSVVESGITLTVGTDYTWTEAGVVERIPRNWSTTWQAIAATWTHGYAPGAPELLVVKQVAASIISRFVGNPEVLQSLTVGGVSETYATAPQLPAGLLYAEQGALGSFKLRRVA